MALLETWESKILESESGVAEIRMDQDLKTLSADIISRACFGSSYSQGNQIFAKIAFLQDALSKPNMLFGFLNFRFVTYTFSLVILPFFFPSELLFSFIYVHIADSFALRLTRR